MVDSFIPTQANSGPKPDNPIPRGASTAYSPVASRAQYCLPCHSFIHRQIRNRQQQKSRLAPAFPGSLL